MEVFIVRTEINNIAVYAELEDAKSFARTFALRMRGEAVVVEKFVTGVPCDASAVEVLYKILYAGENQSEETWIGYERVSPPS